jgi:uroporphyrinogen decarboxylase
MRYGRPDHVPWFDEGLRENPPREEPIPSDRREEPEINLEPIPEPANWPGAMSELEQLRARLDPMDPARLPPDWTTHVDAGPNRDYVLMLRIHRGFFLTLGVHNWSRFAQVMYLVKEDPSFVNAAMHLQGEFGAILADHVLSRVEVDAAIFSEPIGGNDRPLISPRDYHAFALRNYAPILDVLRKHQVETIIFRTYANSRPLIASVLRRGFNCIWACETNSAAMDYSDLRREFGRDLRLIGGIDLDALRSGKDAIRREVLEKVPPLLAQGGYVPLADGRVREDIPFADYAYYRRLLAEVTTCPDNRSSS